MHSFIFYQNFSGLRIGHHQPPDDGRYSAEKRCTRRANCISSVVFIPVIKSDVDGTWAKAYQRDLEQQSSEWRHPHSLRKHKRSTNSKSVLLCHPIPKSDCECRTLQDISPVPSTPCSNIKASTADLQCHLPIWRSYSPLSRHFQKCCQSWGARSIAAASISPDISPCDCDMIPKLNESLRWRTICIEGGHSNSSSVRGGSD